MSSIPSGTDSSEKKDIQTSGVRLLIIRDRFLIRHLNPFVREIIDEITLWNIGKDPSRNVFLTHTSFMPGLEISDDDGCLLAYRPNEAFGTDLSLLLLPQPH